MARGHSPMSRRAFLRLAGSLDLVNLDEQMMSDFQEGTAPDVLQGCCDFLPVWAQKG